MSLPLLIEDVQGLEGRVRLDIFDSSCNLAQVEISNAFGALAVITQEAIEKVAGLVENDQLAVDVEDLINAGTLRDGRKILFDES